MVAIDASGQVLAPFNTLGMYRGWITSRGRVVTGTHSELHEMGAA
jgi:beta-aspartyl-peptidase (threonine type)